MSMSKEEAEMMTCVNPFCFFCTMKEPNCLKRKAELTKCLKQIPIKDDQENIMIITSLWHVAMTHPDDPEFPSLGIFECMVSLINKAIINIPDHHDVHESDYHWLQKDQNIYIPYYATHIIGSYTMNKVEFAEKAVKVGVIPPLMELLRGKMSWVEQRVAVRALGHLASYETTFEALVPYEEELVSLAMNLASTCVHVVYNNFVRINHINRRNIKSLKYKSDLLSSSSTSTSTSFEGCLEVVNCKAEEWTSQIQCWSLYLLNCFAYKERCLNLICNNQDFLKDLCGMWGGLVNQTSPSGVGLIRILCYNEFGRKKISLVKEVIDYLCNLSRSSDDWQYMGIDCLLLLLKDQNTRYKVIENVVFYLVDLVELEDLGQRSNFGEAITKALLLDYHNNNNNNNKLKLYNYKNTQVQKELDNLWDLKNMNVVEMKRKKEKWVLLVGLIKQEAKHMFWLGEIEEAIKKYSEALKFCPLVLRKERMKLYSNRAQCYLLLRVPDCAISDSTRALCLSSPSNSHTRSLWIRSQAYDMKGMAKESLMDCLVFISGFLKYSDNNNSHHHPKRFNKVPHYATRMISKQISATWLFANARSKMKQVVQRESYCHYQEIIGNDRDDEQDYCYKQMMRNMMVKIKGQSNVKVEVPLVGKDGSKTKLERGRKYIKD